MSQHSETTPLFQCRKAEGMTTVQSMRYLHLFRAMNTAEKAFTRGALPTYLRTADTSLWANLCRWLSRLFSFAGSISQKRMLTIDGGTAFLIYSTPNNPRPPWFARVFMPLLNVYRAAEYVKRKNEYSAAVRALVKEAFGEAVNEMYEIQGLAAAPEAQGRGYGKLLVKTVIDMADADERDTWVTTSDARSFYEAQGFSVVGTAKLGADNPAWGADLVDVYILRRATRSQSV